MCSRYPYVVICLQILDSFTRLLFTLDFSQNFEYFTYCIKYRNITMSLFGTIVGATKTVTLSVAAGLTLGQVNELNEAVKVNANLTLKAACNTLEDVGNIGKTIGGVVATGGTAVAAGVTLGKVDCINKAMDNTANFTSNAASATMQGTVREIKSAGRLVTTVAAGAAAGLTLGQSDKINQAYKDGDQALMKSVEDEYQKNNPNDLLS